MKVMHKEYGIGEAIEPFNNNEPLTVYFGSTVKQFIYPRVFDKGTLIPVETSSNLDLTTAENNNYCTVDIDNLLKDYIEDFKRKKNLSFVVKNSIPIVWFGNIEKYFCSNLKVVTIGLNPSAQEFLGKNPKNIMVELSDNSKRFDIINFENENILEQLTKLKNTLNSYFNKNPYNWFNKYNKLLEGIGCSYQSLGFNTAIHIDIYSAIATDPTFGNLTDKEKNLLKNFNLFRRLFNLLKPDVVLISTNKQVFQEQFPFAKIIKNYNLNNNYI